MMLEFSSICFVIHIVMVQAELICKSPSNLEMQKPCSCVVKGSHIKNPTKIDLCQLDNTDYCGILSTSGEGTGSLITRFYILNLFRRIKTSPEPKQKPVTVCSNRLDKQPTNCPLHKSMCCIASITTFECDESACTEPQLTADAYGHFGKWKIREAMRSDGSAMKEARVVIEISAGACYYCQPEGNTVPTLTTTIALFCDERKVGAGHPIIMIQNANIVFHVNTSQACYTFDSQTPERCSTRKSVCENMIFSCISQNYRFSLPVFANQSISKHQSETVEYIFGFCAQNVNCSNYKNAMICKKVRNDTSGEWQATSIVDYTGNDQEVVIRPSGFVWRFRKYGGRLEAVVVFQCDADQPADVKEFSLDVPKYKTPPLLLTLKHRCFCPNPPPECAGRSKPPTPQPKQQTTSSPHDTEALEIAIPVCALACFCVLVFFAFWYNRPPQPPTPPISPPTSTNDTPPTSQSSSDPSTTPSTGSWRSALSHLSIRSLLNRGRTTSGRVSRQGASAAEMDSTVMSDVTPIREEPEPPSENTPLLRKNHSTI